MDIHHGCYQDLYRFVIDTCRHLREKKSYLVWNSIGSLGVSAVSNLVKERCIYLLLIIENF
ncbi:meiosis-specific protein PAIR2 [Iris pallida]|uniref:Meiosis-specific protein PAIR2 n=1 Tax=Iris pallida TaxID=29817 RepID=A0AAX6FGP7_IRIPA|nr:meiosis-specific protein PAIR2 [Iris pallida]